MPPVPVADLPDPPGVDRRFVSVLGTDVFKAIQRYRRDAGCGDEAWLARLGAAARHVDALIAEGYWCGKTPREFVRLFRARRWYKRKHEFGGRTGLASRERLLLATAGFLVAEEDPDASGFAERLRQAVEDRVLAATALLDRGRYLADFEAKYAPWDASASSDTDPGLVGQVALQRACAELGEKGPAARDLVVSLAADALNHFDGLSEAYADGAKNPSRAIGLPVPEGPPELPLRFWVARVVSCRITAYLRGGRVQPEGATDLAYQQIRVAVREVTFATVGDRLDTLTPKQFQVFSIDRFLNPRSQQESPHVKRHGDGRDQIIARLLDTTKGAVYSSRNRSKNKNRDDRGDRSTEGER